MPTTTSSTAATTRSAGPRASTSPWPGPPPSPPRERRVQALPERRPLDRARLWAQWPGARRRTTSACRAWSRPRRRTSLTTRNSTEAARHRPPGPRHRSRPSALVLPNPVHYLEHPCRAVQLHPLGRPALASCPCWLRRSSARASVSSRMRRPARRSCHLGREGSREDSPSEGWPRRWRRPIETWTEREKGARARGVCACGALSRRLRLTAKLQGG
mmetsp:Transcript_80124/g.229992  ORF Transcript_80124/g.229992 Transcript_80124/m.229992 type:complete len:216 (-) Transcript_80124:29-676(-)